MPNIMETDLQVLYLLVPYQYFIAVSSSLSKQYQLGIYNMYMRVINLQQYVCANPSPLSTTSKGGAKVGLVA